ncbi:hypothetical protein ACH5BF_04995 [Arcobacter sp. YIC-464]
MITAMKKGFVYFFFIILIINIFQSLNKKDLNDDIKKENSYISKD